ncbi:MAG TPA: LysR family transcriptional regulator [Burkholderiaceae bacterium]|nr:LysR family transcriptional regulator [Burkholderiaceae bacterium]
MDRLHTMRAFVAVADARSFAAAARQLALSPPALTRAIAALEARIGARLLHRTTRTVRLTDAGARFLADCKRILGEVEEAEAAAAGGSLEPRGQLAVTAPVLFGRMYVAPIVFDFLERYPGVTARTVFVDRIVDLLDEGIDVAVRIAHLPDSSLTAIPVGSVRSVVCAAPRYLAAHGRPRVPDDVTKHRTIAILPTPAAVDWSFAAGTKLRSVRAPAQLTVNNNDLAIAAAVAGRGLARVLSYQIAAEVRAKRLEIVLADFEPKPLPINVVYHEGRRAAAKVRAFADMAVERLRADKSLK